MSLPAARRHLGYSMVEILICRKAVAGGHEITSLDSQNGLTTIVSNTSKLITFLLGSLIAFLIF